MHVTLLTLLTLLCFMPFNTFRLWLRPPGGTHKAYQLPSQQSCSIAKGICSKPSQTHVRVQLKKLRLPMGVKIKYENWHSDPPGGLKCFVFLCWIPRSQCCGMELSGSKQHGEGNYTVWWCTSARNPSTFGGLG